MPGHATVVTVLHQYILLTFLDAIATQVAAGAADLDVELQEVDTERVQVFTDELSRSRLKSNATFLIWVKFGARVPEMSQAGSLALKPSFVAIFSKQFNIFCPERSIL